MSSLIYRIRDWDELYEPSFIRLSPRESMKWVAVPTKQDGHGFVKLVTGKSGPAYFGAWVAMLQVAAKCFPRGVLIRTDGRPHDSLSLSLQTRMPSKLFVLAIPVLADELAWLEVITTSQLADYAELARARYARVRDRADNTEQDNTRPKAKKPRGERAPIRPVDAEYVAEMQATPLYSKLDCQSIYEQMVVWCSVRHKLPTRRRFVNFLNNRVQDALAGEKNGTDSRSSRQGNSGRQTASEKRTGKLAGRDYAGLARSTVDRDKLRSEDD